MFVVECNYENSPVSDSGWPASTLEQFKHDDKIVFKNLQITVIQVFFSIYVGAVLNI